MLRRTTFFGASLTVPRGAAAIAGLLLGFGFG